MHDSHLPLRKWFAAIYLLCQSKKGMSAHQLHRTIGVAYRTAWYLCHRIREAMGNDPFTGPTLFGIHDLKTMVYNEYGSLAPEIARRPLRYAAIEISPSHT